MEKIITKPSKNYFLGIGLFIILGTAVLFVGEDAVPIWVTFVFYAIAIFMVFAIKTTTFEKEGITIKFIAGPNPIYLKKEDIDTIRLKEERYTTAQRVGMMKADNIIEIKAKNSKRIVSVVEKFDRQYHTILQFLKEHYADCWERGDGEIM